MKTNLDFVFNIAKQVYDGMVDRGWGRIINVSLVNRSKGDRPILQLQKPACMGSPNRWLSRRPARV
jgi:hypothetical protein